MKVEISFDQDFQQSQLEDIIIKDSNSITELQLEYFSIYDISSFLEQHKDQFQKLQVLKINSCIFGGSILKFLQEQKSLIHLQLESCWKISSQQLQDFVQVANFSQLKHLNLSGTLINDNFVQTLSLKENQIEELNISFCNLLTDKGLTVLLNSQYLNKIKALYLKCLKLTEITIQALIESKNFVGNLNRLSIYKCYNCSSESIVKLLQSHVAENLQYFDASSSLFDNECLKVIAERDLKNLTTLKFYECSNVNNEGIQILFQSQVIQRLEVLDLSWVYFENSTLELLQNKEFKLKELSIPMIPSLQQETLQRFIQSSKILNTVEVLDLSYNQIDDLIIENIIAKKKQQQNLPLRDLLVYGCQNIQNKKKLQDETFHYNIILNI